MADEAVVVINGERLSRREAFLQLKAGIVDEQLSIPAASAEPEPLSLETEQPTLSVPEPEAASAQEEEPVLEGPDVLIEYELTPDPFTGLYSICAKKPDPNYSAQQANEVFSKYGDIGKMNITKKLIFVCYVSKEDAEAAMEGLQNEFSIFVPAPRSKDNPNPKYKKQQQQAQTNGMASRPEQQYQQQGSSQYQKKPQMQQRQGNHIRSGPCVYIGSISNDLNKEDIETLVSPFNFTEVMFYVRNQGTKRFAFAYFSSPVGAQQAVTTLNGKEVSGKNIVVRHVRDKSRARIIEGGSTFQNRMSGGMTNGYMNAESHGHAHQSGSGMGPSVGLQGSVNVPMSQLQAATDLVYRIDGLMGEVLDDCYFCQRVRGLVNELQYCMQDIQDGASQRHLAARGRGTTMNAAGDGYKSRPGYQPVYAGRGRAGPLPQYR